MDFVQNVLTWIMASITAWMVGGSNPAILSQNTSTQLDFKQNFVWFLVDRPHSLELIPNYEQKIAFRELIVKNSCEKGINGGFYDTDHNPLGLVVINNVEHSPLRANKLFDGFLWVNEERAGITRVDPETASYAIQTGPILIEDRRAKTLAIKNDTYSRRSVAIMTDQDELILGMFYDPDSPLDGPKLADLPKMVLDQADDMDVGIVSAINLDGGSASAFFDGETAVSEWSPVGSVWCLK